MNAQGKSHKYGDNVDTDVIIPARYLNTANHKELASHCMEDIDKDFVNKVSDGDIMIGGANFGCGSSREHAPIAIKESGIACVIAKSFARIFYRNAINIGLAILECPEASEGIADGDEVRIDFDSGVITNVTTGKEFKAQPFPPFIKDIINKILQNHVDCVYVSGFGESYISFVKQFNNDPRTHNIILTGDMTFGLPDTKSKIGITSSVIHYADAIITSDFSKTYTNAYSESPNSYAAYTYTVPFLIQAALDNGCKLNNIDGIYKYITTTSFDSAMGSLCFTCDGESNLQFSMKTLE